MESQPQNPEFRNNPENFHPCVGCYPCYNNILQSKSINSITIKQYKKGSLENIA